MGEIGTYFFKFISFIFSPIPAFYDNNFSCLYRWLLSDFSMRDYADEILPLWELLTSRCWKKTYLSLISPIRRVAARCVSFKLVEVYPRISCFRLRYHAKICIWGTAAWYLCMAAGPCCCCGCADTISTQSLLSCVSVWLAVIKGQSDLQGKQPLHGKNKSISFI